MALIIAVLPLQKPEKAPTSRSQSIPGWNRGSKPRHTRIKDSLVAPARAGRGRHRNHPCWDETGERGHLSAIVFLVNPLNCRGRQIKGIDSDNLFSSKGKLI